jgi:hypothetical protein
MAMYNLKERVLMLDQSWDEATALEEVKSLWPYENGSMRLETRDENGHGQDFAIRPGWGYVLKEARAWKEEPKGKSAPRRQQLDEPTEITAKHGQKKATLTVRRDIAERDLEGLIEEKLRVPMTRED